MNSRSRRAACPGLSAPMQTGDGLLVRMLPIGTIPLAAFGKLCAAAREHGNGVIEITPRGSIQVRGLNAASAPHFADVVAALNIAARDGIPVLSNALAGIDPEEIFDAGAFAADMRRALACGDLAGRLAPKVSVVVDGGGALNFDGLAADVRLRAELINGAIALGIYVGGDGTSATHLGFAAPADGVEAAVRLLEVVASRGRDVRARDILAAEGIAPFSAALEAVVYWCELPLPNGERTKNDAVGLHRLRDGLFACGIGLAFGCAEAALLEELAQAADAAGASGMRAAGRVLMTIGLSPEAARAFIHTAQGRGFIVSADDPRRRIIACAGAPICASAYIAARAIAVNVAPLFGGAPTIHISGCAKGCAHPAAASLTVVGTAEGCTLVAGGTTRDKPFAIVPADRLLAAIADVMREQQDV